MTGTGKKYFTGGCLCEAVTFDDIRIPFIFEFIKIWL